MKDPLMQCHQLGVVPLLLLLSECSESIIPGRVHFLGTRDEGLSSRIPAGRTGGGGRPPPYRRDSILLWCALFFFSSGSLIQHLSLTGGPVLRHHDTVACESVNLAIRKGSTVGPAISGPTDRTNPI